MRDSALSAKNTKRKCEPSSLKNKPRNWRKCDEALKDVLGNESRAAARYRQQMKRAAPEPRALWWAQAAANKAFDTAANDTLGVQLARALAGMYAGLDPGGGAAADAPPPDDDDREEVLLALPRLPPKGSRRVAPAAAFDSS